MCMHMYVHFSSSKHDFFSLIFWSIHYPKYLLVRNLLWTLIYLQKHQEKTSVTNHFIFTSYISGQNSKLFKLNIRDRKACLLKILFLDWKGKIVYHLECSLPCITFIADLFGKMKWIHIFFSWDFSAYHFVGLIRRLERSEFSDSSTQWQS